MLIKLFFYTAVLIVAIFGYRHYAMAGQSLNIGDPAPDFALNDIQGKTHTLADYRGQYLVLYFYPKDDTPGCTKEACHFRDDLSQFKQIGAAVVGISIDSRESHQKFAEKHQLAFPLLADIDGKTAASYGALTNLLLFKIAKRHTFLIGPDGIIKKIYKNVNVSNHSQQILSDIKQMQP